MIQFVNKFVGKNTQVEGKKHVINLSGLELKETMGLFYWYFPLSSLKIVFIHVTVLELAWFYVIGIFCGFSKELYLLNDSTETINC